MSETRPSHHTPEYLDFLKKLEDLKHGEKMLYEAVVRNEVSPNDAEKLIHQAYDTIAQHPGAVSAFVLFIRENNTLDRIVLDKKEHVPDAAELAEKTAAFVAAHPKPLAEGADWRKHDQDYRNYAAAMKGTAVILGSMSAAFLGHYLSQKGVDVTALYGSVLGTALLGHGINKYEEWCKSRPKIERTAPAKMVEESGGIGARVSAGLVSLCAILSMMSGSSNPYDSETAKPHKALNVVNYQSAGLLFPNDLLQ